jgi:thiol-disulfide isomerase/thioredoxin
MKKFLFFFIVPLLLLSCGKKTNFSLSGQIEGGAGKTVYFCKLLPSSQQLIDSAKLDREGKFKFKGRTSSPTFYLLKITENNFVTLLIDSVENSTITGSFKGLAENYRIKGSVGSEMIRDLSFRFSSAKKQLDSLQTIYNLHKNDPLYSSRLKDWEALSRGIMTDHSNYVTGFVKRNPFSLTSIYALYQKWDENDFVINDLQTMKIAASALFSVYPKNEQVIAMYQNTLEIVKNEENKKLKKVMDAKAVNSPNIILPDVDGKEKDLWSLHGKYVLLHFWSAKDPASRTMNPVLSEIYNKYKKRGFEIFMVNVDTDRAAWMEAIEDDNLSCLNVGDMKGCFQAVTNYNIKELPFNYLLDKEGVIIAKNLKGPVLNQVMSQIFK